jgi:tetratricopeptide (TPR) repeat protein
MKRPVLFGMLALLALTTRGIPAAEPRWTMIADRSMTVMGDQSADTLREIATQIQQFRAVVGGLIPNADRPLPLPTVVFVFGARKSLEPYVPVKNGRPASVAGLFVQWPDANHILLSLDSFAESAAVVYHEYTHLLLANAVRTLPVWLNEGLAEYYSSYSLAGDRRSAVIGRPLPWRVGLLRERYMPLRELIAVDSSAALHDESMRRTIFYAEAWALTHYLLTEFPNGAAAINVYAAAIAGGVEPADAFTQAFGETPNAFDKQLQTYIRHPAFVATRFTFTGRLAVATPAQPRPVSPGEMAGWLGDLQRRVGRDAEAAPRIEDAAAKEPDVPICQVALGLLRLSQNRRQEAIDTLNRAESLGRDNFTTQFVRGVALLRADEGASDANTESAARALAGAVALNPDSSEAHAWLAYAQMQSSATLPQARASIERAIELSPGRLDYRLRYADIRILQGQPNEVRALLTAISSIKTDPAMAARARTRIDAMLASARHASERAATESPVDASADSRSGAPAGPRSESRAIATPSIDPTPSAPDPRVRLRLRHQQDGEQRAFGLLTHVNCSPNEVQFHVRAQDVDLVATARRMEDVELIQYLDGNDFVLACNARVPPYPVFLTWRPATASAASHVGTAVAVEFVPKNYVPQ